MEFFGDPVVMSDRDGNQVRGKRMLYFMDDGKVEVKGKDGEAGGSAGARTGGAPTATPATRGQATRERR